MYRNNNRPNARFHRGGFHGSDSQGSQSSGGQRRFGGRGQGQRSFNRHSAPKKFGKHIHPSLFVNKAVEVIEEPAIEVNRTFADLNLDSRIVERVLSRGYDKPTPIQDQAIDHVINGRDLLGIANTGTGKTAAFLLPIMNRVLADRNTKALIMVPTRELALQIEREFRAFATGLQMFSVICIGGTSMQRQIYDLKRSFNLVIGTPGRLKDLQQSRHLKFDQFSVVVLDEVDQMLDMGFIHDMRAILKLLPAERQSLFFSATMTDQIKQLIAQFSTNLVTVSVKKVETAQTIDQDVVHFTSPEHKLVLLREMLQADEFTKVLIFGRTKHGVHKLAQKLSTQGFRAESIHGNKTQPQRQKALKRFHAAEVNILVATDVAARGLDIADVSHVINFDIPATYEDYVHRIGRTGRANKRGKALTFIGNQ